MHSFVLITSIALLAAPVALGHPYDDYIYERGLGTDLITAIQARDILNALYAAIDRRAVTMGEYDGRLAARNSDSPLRPDSVESPRPAGQGPAHRSPPVLSSQRVPPPAPSPPGSDSRPSSGLSFISDSSTRWWLDGDRSASPGPYGGKSGGPNRPPPAPSPPRAKSPPAQLSVALNRPLPAPKAILPISRAKVEKQHASMEKQAEQMSAEYVEKMQANENISRPSSSGGK